METVTIARSSLAGLTRAETTLFYFSLPLTNTLENPGSIIGVGSMLRKAMSSGVKSWELLVNSGNGGEMGFSVAV